MRLVFLGTGGSIPAPNRNVSATALQLASEMILFDCGEGTQRQFMMSSASFMKVHKIFVTHFHADHFLGIPGMIQSMNFVGRDKPLEVFGPSGMIDIMRSLLRIGYFSPGFDVHVYELKAGEVVKFPGYSVEAVEVDHNVPALGYVLLGENRPGKFNLDAARALGVPEGPLFRALQQGKAVKVGKKTVTPDMVLGEARPGLKIAFSGDTRPCNRLIEAARGADVLVHEATADSSLRARADEFGHSTAEGAATVAAKANVSILYLNHISSRYEDTAVLGEEARRIFPKTKVVEDLMSVTVRMKE
ncbi:MAG: ribonuclease Z [Methanomassiliicoccales archaeon]|nr:ribonuclease Z [Methanomassiliicoccales archaeon]